MTWSEIAKTYLVDTLEFIKSGKDVAITGVVLVALGVFLFRLGNKLTSERLERNKAAKIYLEMETVSGVGEGLSKIFSFLAMAIGLFIFVNGSSWSIKAYVAPRVVIIEKLSAAVKQ